MSTVNGVTLKKMTYNGQKVKKWNHNGVRVFSAGNVVTYQVDTNVTYQEEVDADASCLSPTTFTPTKSGYTFLGWRGDTAASATVLTEKVMADEPITLYAVFQKTITLSYNGNSSTSGSTAAQTGTQYYNNGNATSCTFTLRANGFTRTSYTFACWAQGSASGTQYKPGATVTLSADGTFYAYWVLTDTAFNYTGGVQTFTAPVAGTYQLNVYGAQGGTGRNPSDAAVTGGKGGYAKGNVTLIKGQTIYVVVGGAGSESYGNYPAVNGGYNGGGAARWAGIDGYARGCGSGGGATHIGKTNNLLKNTSVSNLFIVAGGGGGAGGGGSTGGSGGGTSGGGANGNTTAGASGCGTQTAGGASFDGNGAGGYGYGGSYDTGGVGAAGGGGGYYGGSSSKWGAGGGSGYIGGVSSGSTSNDVRSGNGYALIRFVSAS